MDDSRIFKKLTGGYFGGRRPVLKPTGRWEGVVRKDTFGCLQIQNWKAAESKREVCRQDIGKTMAKKMGQIAVEKKKVALKHAHKILSSHTSSI
jgi:hypothetical protein